MATAEPESEVETVLPEYTNPEPGPEVPEPEILHPTQGKEVIGIAEGAIYIGGRPWYLQPTPNWTSLAEDTGALWNLHNYASATVFLILFLVSAYHLVRILRMNDSIARPYYVALQTIMLICGLLRAIHFFADPYHSVNNLPSVIAFMTLHVFDPSVLSAFILVYVALVKVTAIQALSLSDYLIHPATLVVVIAFNYLVVLSADLLVSFVMGASLYKFICQMYFISMGLLASALYVYLFWRLYSRIYLTRVKLNKMTVKYKKPTTKNDKPLKGRFLKNNPQVSMVNEVQDTRTVEKRTSPECVTPLSSQVNTQSGIPDEVQISPNFSSPGTESVSSEDSYTSSTPLPIDAHKSITYPKMAPLNEQEEQKDQIHLELEAKDTAIVRRLSGIPDMVTPKVPLAAKLILSAAVVFMLLSICNLLLSILSGVKMCEDDAGVPDSWYWLGYQTAMRLLEFTMVAVIATIAAMPLYNMG